MGAPDARRELSSLDPGDHKPTLLDADTDALSRYHVVVWLNGDPHKHVAEMPYHTVLLRWDLPKLADVDGGISQRLREIAQALRNDLHALPGFAAHLSGNSLLKGLLVAFFGLLLAFVLLPRHQWVEASVCRCAPH